MLTQHTRSQDELIVGLDFGAQKLVVAAHLKSVGKLPQIINNNLSNHSTPYARKVVNQYLLNLCRSLVAYKEKHRYLGEEATGHVIYTKSVRCKSSII
jgi:molecular chaperone DnaK (HSP70)